MSSEFQDRALSPRRLAAAPRIICCIHFNEKRHWLDQDQKSSDFPCATNTNMKRHRAQFIATATFLALLLATKQSASAATKNGADALALAALVAVHSPVSNMSEMILTRRLFNGHFHQLRGDTKAISVTADSIICSAGTVDITAHSCKLTFGAKTVNLTGRAAHELYATMAQAGVPSQSTANASSKGLSHLVCTINPLEIAKRGSGGASCTFDAGT